jgi:hypothetical protein
MARVGGKLVVVRGAAAGSRAAEARALAVAGAGASIAAGGSTSGAHLCHDAVCFCGSPFTSADTPDDLQFAARAS